MTVKEKIQAKQEKVSELRSQLKQKVTETRAAAEGDGATSDSLQESLDAINQVKADIAQLETDIEALQKVAGLDETDPSDATETNDATDEIDSKRDSKNEEGELRTSQPKGELRTVKAVEKNEKREAEIRAFEAYVRTRGAERREGLTTVEAEPVIPTQILNLYQMPENASDLSKLVNNVSVSAPSGHLPVSARSNDKMVTAEELAANPELAVSIGQVDYDLKTYRGVIPVSEESLSDSEIDLGAFISERIQRQKFNTEQAGIAAVLKTATAVTATSVDDIKDVFNVQIPTGYNKTFVMTQSAYGELDKVKDDNGRYLLQDSISSASGKTILGAPVVIVDDTLLGAAGDKLVFVGDLRAFVLEPHKVDMTVKWVDNDIYGTKFLAVFRADFKKASEEAGKLVTLNLTAGV